MSSKTVRRVAALPVSLVLAVAMYYIVAWGQTDGSETPGIMGVGTFVVSMICFFGGMRRPRLR